MRIVDADALINNRDIQINIGAGDNICIDVADIAKTPTGIWQQIYRIG